MRAVGRLTGLSLGLAAAIACTNQLPTFIDEDAVATVELNGCSVVNVRSSCVLTARAFNDRGTHIPGANLSWRSTRPFVATVTGIRDEATVNGVNPGRASIVVSGGGASAETSVRVVTR